MLPVGLGLGAAVAIGVGDFAAAIAARRLPALVVGFWSQATALGLGVLMLLLARPALVEGQIAWGLAAGLASGVGLTFLYRAMATGAVSLVTPIAACSVVIPVVYAVAGGERVTPLVAAGTAAIIAGIVLASLQPAPVLPDPTDTGIAGDRRAVLLAIVSAVAFGAFFIMIDRAPQAAGWGTLWTAAAARLTSFAVQGALVLRGPRRVSSPGRYGLAVAAAGGLDQISLVLIGAGAMTDAYGIVTALVGLYPVVTALLGVVLLSERLTRIQSTGAALAMAGVMLVSI